MRTEELQKTHAAEADEVVQKMADEAAKARDTISQLQSELEGLRVATTENKANADEASKLHARNSQLNAELEEMRSAATEREVVAEKAKQAELEKLRAVHADELHRLESEVASARDATATAEANANELDRLRAVQMDEAGRVKSEAAEALDTIAQLQAELKTLHAVAEQKNVMAMATSEELERLRAMQLEETQRFEVEAAKTRDAIAAERVKADGLEQGHAAQVQRLEAEVSRVRESIAAEKNRSDKFEKAHAAQGDEVQKLKSEIAKFRDTTAGQKADSDELEKLRSALADQAERREGEAGKAHDTIVQLQAEVQTLRVSAESEDAGAKARDEELDKLRALHADDARRREAEATASRSSIEQLTKARDTINDLQAEVERLRVVAAERKGAVDAGDQVELRSQLKKAAADQEEADSELAALRKQLKDANATSLRLKKASEQEVRNAKSLREKLAKAQAEIAVSKAVPRNGQQAMHGQKRRVVGDEELMVSESFMAKRPCLAAGQNSGGRPRLQQVNRWVSSDYEICWDFQLRGVCRRGRRCRWRHPPPVPAIKPAWVTAVKEEPEDD